MKTITVLDYGKFEKTTLKDVFNLPFTEFRGAARCLYALFGDESEAYAIMTRTTSDGMPLLFWSNAATSRAYFSQITPEIAEHLIRMTPESYRQGGFTKA